VHLVGIYILNFITMHRPINIKFRSIFSCVRLHIKNNTWRSLFHPYTICSGCCRGLNVAPTLTNNLRFPLHPTPPPKKKSQWHFLIYWFERSCDGETGSGSRLRKDEACRGQAASHGRRSSSVCFGPYYYSRLYMSHFCTKCALCVCVCVHKHTTCNATHSIRLQANARHNEVQHRGNSQGTASISTGGCLDTSHFVYLLTLH
jgi:hypothetical protein